MGNRVLHSAETGAIRSVPTFELQFVPAHEASVLPFPQAHLPEEEWPENAPGCVRGVRFALAIEAAAALMIYAIWHFSHLWR